MADRAWASMPQMHVARNAGSSCLLSNSLYVFCGHKTAGYLNSVERLRIVESESEQNDQAWELLHSQADESNNVRFELTARELPLACPLNSS